jgi:aminoglycoside 3-N-acetyltransferase I
MQIKKLEKGDISDFTKLIHIFKDVFENEEEVALPEQLEKLLSNPDFLVFVVSINDEVIGGLTIYVLQSYYHSKPVAYIYDVGIAPHFQGKGYGKALMAEVCNFCRQNGFEDAYVEAESDDIAAVEFYRKTKFSSEMNATHFTYSFNKEK